MEPIEHGSLDIFFENEDDLRRAKIGQLENVLKVLLGLPPLINSNTGSINIQITLESKDEANGLIFCKTSALQKWIVVAYNSIQNTSGISNFIYLKFLFIK
ncbi:hypothetical protein D5R40_29750 [Okeania hirsuta]|uniref:Uncharacterized protein n=1 Tax=Okeania hirsuta TaxID=1458930 RepID=A0A3N6PFS4_9CYAN|nr:hypothetical protein D5R40_29750 [Okeania hirsuta]